jgi:ADP-ribosylglycohydrolase
MKHSSRVDRARGSMLGKAIGDALGAPLEGLSAQQVRQAYGQVGDYVDGVIAWRKKPLRWRLKGLYTDDTQQALIVAQGLIDSGTVDAESLARAYLDLSNPKGTYLGGHRGVGSSFRLVLSALERGMPALEAGQASAGCGAAVRVAPVALYHIDSPDAMLPAVIAASLMTHRDQRSLAGAVAIAYAVRMLAEGQPREPSLLFQLAAAVARAEDHIADNTPQRVLCAQEHRHAVSVAIAHVESLLDRPREQAYASLMEEANRHGPEQDCRRPTVGFPPACIPTCLYVLFTTDSLEDALIEVINLGGDADTAGAMLGAMAGALYGERGIPERWLAGLKNRQGVALRGELLATPGHSLISVMPPLLETEQILTGEEAAMREDRLVRLQKGDDLGANRRWR